MRLLTRGYWCWTFVLSISTYADTATGRRARVRDNERQVPQCVEKTGNRPTLAHAGPQRALRIESVSGMPRSS